MFGLGVWEIAIILGFALVVLGPQKLPAVAKTLGRSLRELRRAASDFQVTLEQEADAEERRQRLASLPAATSTQRASATPTSGADNGDGADAPLENDERKQEQHEVAPDTTTEGGPTEMITDSKDRA